MHIAVDWLDFSVLIQRFQGDFVILLEKAEEISVLQVRHAGLLLVIIKKALDEQSIFCFLLSSDPSRFIVPELLRTKLDSGVLVHANQNDVYLFKELLRNRFLVREI